MCRQLKVGYDATLFTATAKRKPRNAFSPAELVGQAAGRALLKDGALDRIEE
jgi:hypothetical protein